MYYLYQNGVLVGAFKSRDNAVAEAWSLSGKDFLNKTVTVVYVYVDGREEIDWKKRCQNSDVWVSINNQTQL